MRYEKERGRQTGAARSGLPLPLTTIKGSDSAMNAPTLKAGLSRSTHAATNSYRRASRVRLRVG